MIISAIRNINFYPVFKGKQDLSKYCMLDNKDLNKDKFEFNHEKSEAIPNEVLKAFNIDKKAKCININELKSPKRDYIKKVSTYIQKDLCSKIFEEYLPVIEKFKNLEADSDVNLLEGIDERDFDLSLLMEIGISNSLRKYGNSHIFGEKTPKLFEGIDKHKVAEAIDDVMNKITEHKMFSHQIGRFSISNKDFYIKYEHSGMVGTVYKICDKKGNCCAIKRYEGIIEYPMNNGKTEIAVLRQARREDVQDVPEFYMANAGDYKLDENEKPYKTSRWMMMEFIDRDTPLKPWNKEKHKIAPSYIRYFKSKYGLLYQDNKNTNYIGEYLVDMGGFVNESYLDWEGDDITDDGDEELYEKINDHINKFNEYQTYMTNCLKKNSMAIQEIINAHKK